MCVACILGIVECKRAQPSGIWWQFEPTIDDRALGDDRATGGAFVRMRERSFPAVGKLSKRSVSSHRKGYTTCTRGYVTMVLCYVIIG